MRSPQTPVRKNPRAGFTLIELLAVMVILLLLASIVLYTAKAVTDKSRYAKAQAYMRAKSNDAEREYSDKRMYPNWGTNGIGTDPWGVAYRYETFPGTGVGYTQRQFFAMYCFGADKTPGNAKMPGSKPGDGDDITMGNYGRRWGVQKE